MIAEVHAANSRVKSTCSTVFKALDTLTILTGEETGLSLPDLALALNQPRSNTVRLVQTLQQYGLVARDGRRWVATAAFREWSSPSGRHDALRQRYRPVVQALAAATRERTVLGVHEGNGVLHLDCVDLSASPGSTAAVGIRHGLRYNALGKLALSRRPDLAAHFEDPAFHRELDDIRRTGVAWSRGESAPGFVAMAIAGFDNRPTEPMLSVIWPKARFTEVAAERAREVARTALTASAPAGPIELMRIAR